MTKDLSFFPLRTALKEIEILCEKSRSGIVYLISDDNRLAQVHLLKGMVVSAVYRNKRGTEALEQIRSIQFCTLRIDDKVAPTGTPDLSNETFFAYLNYQSTLGASVTRAGPLTQPRVDLSPEAKLIFERVLKKYMGPIASIVCEDHLEQTHDVATLTEALAGEIPNAEEALKFRRDVALALKQANT